MKNKKSPKCPSCLGRGIMAQMYRVAGTPIFRCHSCRWEEHAMNFEPIDFHWHDQEKDWRTFHNWNGLMKEGSHNGS